MYFPNEMPVQYFFFDTYPGMFLQVIPVAVLAGVVYLLVDRWKNHRISRKKKLFRALFACYLAGLLCLTLLMGVLQTIYYWLLYHQPSGNSIAWFSGIWDWTPDFFVRFGAEDLLNILLFCPFGLLYPLACKKPSWKHTLLAGMTVCLAIELFQPILGRSFDSNDIILNLLGVCLSTILFFGAKKWWRHRNRA